MLAYLASCDLLLVSSPLCSDNSGITPRSASARAQSISSVRILCSGASSRDCAKQSRVDIGTPTLWWLERPSARPMADCSHTPRVQRSLVLITSVPYRTFRKPAWMAHGHYQSAAFWSGPALHSTQLPRVDSCTVWITHIASTFATMAATPWFSSSHQINLKTRGTLLG